MLGSLWAKLAGAGVIVLGVLLAALRLFSMGKKAERNHISSETAKVERKVTKDAKKEHEAVRRAGPDAARERMRKRSERNN